MKEKREKERVASHATCEQHTPLHGTYLVPRRDEVLERREDRQPSTNSRLMQKLSAALAARNNNLVIKRLRGRKRLLIRRDDVHARAQQRRVRLRHGHSGRIVDEHDDIVAAHERRELALEVCHGVRGSGGGGGTEEGFPVGGGRDAVWVEDGCFGGGERDEAEGVRRLQCLELAYELGADSSDAYDGDGDGFGDFRGHGRVGESNKRKARSKASRGK